MSSSSSATTDPVSTTALPTTTTFLPVLDDLLSPDFRPVTHPPIVTPLQTPTTATSSNVVVPQQQQNGEIKAKLDKSDAAKKIQKWWKSNRIGSRSVDGEDEKDLKHRIRHKRTEEYIRHLESEVTRLKQSLTAERKLRSLQFEAIRSLWSQVQKITANNIQDQPLLMTQSLPNGLPQELMKPALPQPCTCTNEIIQLKNKVETEMSELRKLVNQLILSKETSEQEEGSPNKATKRPDTLDLGGNGVKHGELQGYADSVARSVVEQAGLCGGEGDSNEQG